MPESAVCLRCGYSLRGLPNVVCPECGRAFDPGDASTYRDRATKPSWRRWAKPPSLWHTLSVVVMTLLVLDAQSTALGWGGVGGILTLCALIPIGPILVGVYLTYATAAYADRRRAESDHGEHTRRRKWRWLVTPVCLGLVISATLSRWPLHVRFAASRPALEAEARRLRAFGSTAAGAGPGFLIPYNRFVGLYYVHQVYVDQITPSVLFITDDDLIDAWGFIYCPGQACGIDVGLPDGWGISES